MPISNRIQVYARIFRELPRETVADLMVAIAGDPQLTSKSEVAQGAALATFANAMWPKKEEVDR